MDPALAEEYADIDKGEELVDERLLTDRYHDVDAAAPVGGAVDDHDDHDANEDLVTSSGRQVRRIDDVEELPAKRVKIASRLLEGFIVTR